MTRRQAVDRKRRIARRAKARTRAATRLIGWGMTLPFTALAYEIWKYAEDLNRHKDFQPLFPAEVRR